ncbi:MAG TPA: hypothetical protein VGV18_03050 [Verrucomicrobiae bacterium]|nr:hypothetical protein [Verrucomicrobiae bacterium]
MPEPQRQTGPGEIHFRRIVSISTALSLAVAYGWLAGFVRQPNGKLTFQWRWLVAVWALTGIVTTIYFWRKIWPPVDRAASRRGIVKGTVALALPGIWWLIFPLRSQSGQNLWQVIEGLAAAALVLTFGAWMLIRLGRAFEDK